MTQKGIKKQPVSLRPIVNTDSELTFNYNYIRAIANFEYAALEGQDLQFHHNVFIPQICPDNKMLIKPIQQLEVGLNVNCCMKLKIIRVTRLTNCTYLMCAIRSKQNCSYRLVILIVVSSAQRKQDLLMQECLLPNNYLEIRHIYLKSLYEETPIMMVACQNVHITDTKSNQNRDKRKDFSSQQIRQQGNNYFKKAKYVQAIDHYEQSIIRLIGPSKKNRSILYSNTAACFFELRLYSSCVIYADLAIAYDESYNKGYFRKINALLQLKKYKDVIPFFVKINTLISKADCESIIKKYTDYMANQSGVINWMSLIKGKNVPQSQYYSQKIQKVRNQDQVQYYAKQKINKYEIILINKPLIYIREANQKFKESFIKFLKEIQNYYLYDSNFQESIHELPCKCHPTLTERQLYYNHYKHKCVSLPKKQLFNKMQRCIFEQKSLDKPQDENGYGIWKQMFYLQNKCLPNCTAVHINSYLVINAMTDIQKGQPLSIDLIADVQSGKRKQTLNIKFDVECGCQICEYKESKDIEFYKIEQLYDRFEKYQLSKLKKQHIWSIINYQWEDRQNYESQFRNLIEYYIYQIQKQCQWDDVLNLLRLKEQNDNEEINNHIDEALKRQISQFLNVDSDKIDELYIQIIDKYMREDSTD